MKKWWIIFPGIFLLMLFGAFNLSLFNGNLVNETGKFAML
jgi:hypothetical protein